MHRQRQAAAARNAWSDVRASPTQPAGRGNQTAAPSRSRVRPLARLVFLSIKKVRFLLLLLKVPSKT
jgi:hypothetical protein